MSETTHDAPVDDDGELRIAAWVDRARGGDREAFARLYRRFLPLVHGVLLARVAPQEADDLAQEVFLAAWKSLDRLREARHFGAWVAGIARHHASDHHRRRRTVPLGDREPAVTDPRRAEAAEVLEAIQRLPEAYREPLVLRLVEGMTGPEIAERCGLTHGSVRVNLHRGMKKLRAQLTGGETSPRTTP